jgi:ribosome-associated protein
MSFDLPEAALSESFLAATGPGGQNVNKVATACQLRARVDALGLAADVEARLRRLAGSRLTADGEIVITARRFRTREANREDARRRLADLVERAHFVQPKRRPTKPGKTAKARRVEQKRQRSQVKRGRGRVSFD